VYTLSPVINQELSPIFLFLCERFEEIFFPTNFFLNFTDKDISSSTQRLLIYRKTITFWFLGALYQLVN